jgi:hypothetical protein
MKLYFERHDSSLSLHTSSHFAQTLPSQVTMHARLSLFSTLVWPRCTRLCNASNRVLSLRSGGQCAFSSKGANASDALPGTISPVSSGPLAELTEEVLHADPFAVQHTEEFQTLKESQRKCMLTCSEVCLCSCSRCPCSCLCMLVVLHCRVVVPSPASSTQGLLCVFHH